MATAKATRTSYELYVEQLLQFLKIPHKVNHIYCFACKKSFFWDKKRGPDTCFVGLHAFHKGDYCRPDFIIGENHAILRIDGSVHEKRSVKKRDKWQETILKSSNTPYFVTKNGFWFNEHDKIYRKIAPDKIPPAHLDYLLSMYQQIKDPALYTKFQQLPPIKATKLVKRGKKA